MITTSQRDDSIGPKAPIPLLYSNSLVRSTSTIRSRRPSLSHSDSFRNSINIVNSNYDHYGKSLVKRSVSRTEGGNSGTDKHPSYDSFQIKNPPSPMNSTPPPQSQSQPKEGKPKVSYRSLLLQSENNTFKKLFNKLDQSEFFKSNSAKSNSQPYIPDTLNNFPIEILNLIVDYSDDLHSQVTCLYVSKSFHKATKPLIYHTPLLTSTYRVAQLLTSIRENPENGKLIKNLDFSKLEAGVIVQEDQNPSGSTDSETGEGNDTDSLNDAGSVLDYAYASWRDWKYRGDPLYGSSFLNSYTLSKSKSTLSVDSMPVYTTHSNISGLSLICRFKSSSSNIDAKSPISKIKSFLKLKLTRSKRPRSFSDVTNDNRSSSKKSTSERNKLNVRFGAVSNPKFRPFHDDHPYTNKFLLKYANSKDIPIGYLLYFIELCPNIVSLNMSSITLSSDHKIIYRHGSGTTSSAPGTVSRPRGTSLVEDALIFLTPHNSSRNSLRTSMSFNHQDQIKPKYLSDSNVYFDVKTFDNEFKELTEMDVLDSILENLSHLEVLKMACIPWLNFKNVQDMFIKKANKLVASRLQGAGKLEIDLTNSGMIKNMRWATNYKNVEDFVEMFSKTQRQIDELEIDPVRAFHDSIMRNVGMNY
ncbi:hypothetical protein WICPIJ_004636 [Wickerhamomyces pijperi]|uniref:F-box domain-containing protein n=1 Tax=Wickerhamomyces pijperi TaxID=599730 RepID=A0A9P8TN36_WICPI|nr:hypothetical protein WICPIJ_004636 [Wickerhamomyces pijperi]